MNAVVPYTFDGASVRVIEISGEPWFVGKDVAEALGYVDASTAIRSHCKGVQRLHPLQTSGGKQDVRILAEPDVLRLIMNSTLPAAERFERWVFEEVLPSIRKTGAYSVVPRTPAQMFMASAEALLAIEHEQAQIRTDVTRIETKVDELAESRVWDHCPQNCEPITKIRERINSRYGLPAWVIDKVIWQLPLSPKPVGMVSNQREEANGSHYAAYAVADVTRVFEQFVAECVMETPTRASHRHIDKAFQLMRDGKTPKALKAHAKAAA